MAASPLQRLGRSADCEQPPAGRTWTICLRKASLRGVAQNPRRPSPSRKIDKSSFVDSPPRGALRAVHLHESH